MSALLTQAIFAWGLDWIHEWSWISRDKIDRTSGRPESIPANTESAMRRYLSPIVLLRIVPGKRFRDFPGAHNIVYGPFNGGPIGIYDVIGIYPRSDQDAMICQINWHPNQGGFLFQGGLNSVQGEKIFTYFKDSDYFKGNAVHVATSTRLNDGTFRVELESRFQFELMNSEHGFPEYCRRFRSWDEYFHHHPVILP